MQFWHSTLRIAVNWLLEMTQKVVLKQPFCHRLSLNRSDYVAKMEEILQDTTKFKKCDGQGAYEVSRKTERKVRDFLRDKFKEPGYITDDEYKKPYPNGSHIGVFYGLPKVHKEGIPTRPICSAIGTSTYNLGSSGTWQI